MRYLILLFTLFILGCNSNSSSSSTTTTTTTSQSNIVKVFTLGPVLNALVTDNNNQVATFDNNTSSYIFSNTITYPITVTATNDTFVDVDYDKNKTAIDIKPIFTTLKSFNNQINFLTNLYYSNEYNESNVTIDEYKQLIENKFNIDIDIAATSDENIAKILFASYNYISNSHSFITINDIDSEVDNVKNFFDHYLENLDVNKTQYYSRYDSLIQLDKRVINRIDTLHKPLITLLRDDINITDKNNNIDVFDSIIKENVIYTAAGHEELQLLDNSLNLLDSSGADLLSFGRNLYYEQYNNNECLFLANSNDGVKVFNAINNTIDNTSNIKKYLDGDNQEHNFTSNYVLHTNGYVSPQNSKRLLSITTSDNGVFLINIKDIFTNCSLNTEINSSEILIPNLDTGISQITTISSVFRNDGSYLYVSTPTSILGYNLEILDKSNIENSKTSFALEQNEEAYNLMLINNDNELFVTTNKGVQLYNINNSNQLQFISEYPTEGANENYYPKIDFYNNYLFFTDGYKGLKVIKYDTSFNPMLCGVEYFAPNTNPEELAKVNSVKYNDGYLYVGIDSYGIVKFKMEDILFKHCKE